MATDAPPTMTDRALAIPRRFTRPGVHPYDEVAWGPREAQIVEPNRYLIDRERPRNHLSFGFGIHRCVGNRLAELQLTIIWEEILKRFPEIRVVGDPVLNWSAFVHGYESLPVIIPSRN